MTVDKRKLQDACLLILDAIGEDSTRPGLSNTPWRFANWWEEFIDYKPGTLDTTFESISTDQMVVVSGMKIVSLCEHHLLPFFSEIAIGYITNEKVLGLSKFARIAHKYAHRLQIQERLVDQISNEVIEYTQTGDVAVLAQGVHLCMSMRGIQTDGIMTTSKMRGDFYEDPSTREEFLRLIRSAKDVQF